VPRQLHAQRLNHATLQDELYIPSDYFSFHRGSGGHPAPPFPPPVECDEPPESGWTAESPNAGELDPSRTDGCVVIAEDSQCPYPGGGSDTGVKMLKDALTGVGGFNKDAVDEDNLNLCSDADESLLKAQFPRNLDGECKCTGPGKDCACIREFLLHTRPPGINGYDGLDLNIAIVADDKCNVLYLPSPCDRLMAAGSLNWLRFAYAVETWCGAE
jgi:hypothetical protein